MVVPNIGTTITFTLRGIRTKEADNQHNHYIYTSSSSRCVLILFHYFFLGSRVNFSLVGKKSLVSAMTLIEVMANYKKSIACLLFGSPLKLSLFTLPLPAPPPTAPVTSTGSSRSVCSLSYVILCHFSFLVS
jgi:hypothetical protein